MFSLISKEVAKVMLVLAIIALALTFVINANAEEDIYYHGDRIVDVVQCAPLMTSRNAFLWCSARFICESDAIVKDPIGEFYGIKSLIPVQDQKNPEIYIWDVRVFKSNMTDTDTVEFCRQNNLLKVVDEKEVNKEVM